MIDPAPKPAAEPRKPRAFKIDDAVIVEPDELGSSASGSITSRREQPPRPRSRLTTGDVQRGIRWGSIMLSAMAALASLAASLWFARFVSVALERHDWIGWTAFALMCIIGFAGTILVVRELWGFRRLARLARLRRQVRQALDAKDAKLEQAVIADLVAHYRNRADLSWGIARLAEHSGDVLQPGERLRLADRELLVPIDAEARRVILKSAKRVATVTALSPIMWIAMAFVAIENLRMFRALASLYGGRPGLFGALRLARLVITHIIATGGLAMTDDLLGQFLGQDVLRRLSRRLGEGAFNGALTGRLGVAAVEVSRPLPYLDAEPLRVREILGELMRSLRTGETKTDPGSS